MSFEDIKLLLTDKFGAEVIAGEETGGLQPALLIAPTRIADVCLELRDGLSLGLYPLPNTAYIKG